MNTDPKNSRIPETVHPEAELCYYKKLYDLAPVPYFVLDSDAQVINHNEEVSHLTGLHSDRIINRPLEAFIIEEDKTRFKAFLGKMQETGTIQSCEFRLNIGRDPAVPVICSGYHSRNSEEPARWFITFINTRHSDPCNIRIQHNQNISFFADLIEHTSHPFAVAYPNGQIRLCNTSFETLLGYSAEELSVLDWAGDLTPDEWKMHEREKLNELHRTGKPVQYEKEYIRKDGTRVPVELFVHLVSDEMGSPQYYYSFISDITERKKAEIELKKSEDRFLQLAENVEQIFWFTEVNPERVLYVNPSFERLWGVPAEELYKNPRIWGDHIHPDDKTRVLEAFSAWIEGSSPVYDVEYCILDRYGKIKWIHDRGAAVVKKDGTVVQVSGIAEDITHLKLRDVPQSEHKKNG
jgi:PAS domain S-box-containing protein